MKRDMLDVKKMLANEYFPVELPECFTSGDIVKHYIALKGQLSATNYSSSKPWLFSVYKSEHARRRMAIPNIYHYFKVSELLCENYEELKDVYKLSKYSLTKPSTDQSNTEKRAYNRVSNNQNETRLKNESLFMDNTICIKLDISNCFDSIYTHSVAWAIHSKEVSKQNKGDKSLLGNRIDNCLQGLNDRQTHGILVGNAVSRLIAELILCKVDEQIKKTFPKIDMCRFVDDYTFYIKGGAVSEYNADKIITYVREQLLEYDLVLNESKTTIISAPFNLGQNGIDELKSVTIKDAYLYSNRMIVIYNKYNDGALLKYGLRVLFSTIKDSDFKKVFPLLLNLWVRFPFLAEYILPIINKYRDVLSKTDRNNLLMILQSIIINGIIYRQETEVVWALWAAILFRISITSRLLNKICESNNDLAIIMVLNYLHDTASDAKFYQKALKQLENKIIQDVNLIGSCPDDEKILTSHWLLIYELVAKKIIDSGIFIDYIKSNQFFKKMLELGVDFYHPNIMVENPIKIESVDRYMQLWEY